jgi:hypothetical protein
MTFDLVKVRTVHGQLLNLLERKALVLRQAADTQQQHWILTDSARLYVENMGAFVHTLIVRAADELAILEPSLSEPVSDLHGIYMDVRYARLAERSGAKVESIAEAAFAASQRFTEMASHLVSHLEKCVSHDQTITGEVIPRGAFC